MSDVDPLPPSRREAIDRYSEGLRRSLAVVAGNNARFLDYSAVGQTGNEISLYTDPNPVRLIKALDGSSVYLFANHRFEAVPASDGVSGWTTRTLGYGYLISMTDDLLDASYVYHWHPETRDGAHVHIASHDEASTIQEGVHGHHLPSGRIAFEDVVRLLIDEFGVGASPNAHAVLRECEDAFRSTRSWE